MDSRDDRWMFTSTDSAATLELNLNKALLCGRRINADIVRGILNFYCFVVETDPSNNKETIRGFFHCEFRVEGSFAPSRICGRDFDSNMQCIFSGNWDTKKNYTPAVFPKISPTKGKSLNDCVKWCVRSQTNPLHIAGYITRDLRKQISSIENTRIRTWCSTHLRSPQCRIWYNPSNPSKEEESTPQKKQITAKDIKQAPILTANSKRNRE
jgi:hypothetical protein